MSDQPRPSDTLRRRPGPSDTYHVQLLDGPAAGWSYVTFIAPPPAIEVAPSSRRRGFWFRVPVGAVPWPGQCRYEQAGAEERFTPEGDILVTYTVVS